MQNEEYETEVIKIKAQLDKIIFHNQDNGFLIGSFVVESADHSCIMATCKGSMLNPQISMEYILFGTWEHVPRYGEQFKFSSFETIQPSDIDGIFKYLVRVCKFVGPTIAERLLDEFGEMTLEMLKTEPEDVTNSIKGITLEKALSIQSSLLENEADEKQMIELETILNVPGMRKNMAVELIKRFKSNAVDEVKRNPYVLTFFNGIGFALADRVALHIDYPANGIERKKAAVMHCIRENMQMGHVWIRYDDLMKEIKSLIQVPLPDEGVEKLMDEGELVERYGGNLNLFYALKRPAEHEAYIVSKVVEMLHIERTMEVAA